MNRLSYCLLQVLLVAVCLSCTDSSSEDTPVLEVEMNEVVFASDGGSEFIKLKHNQKEVSIEVEGSWIEAVIEGNVLRVDVSLNRSALDREGQVVLSSRGITQQIKVAQQGAHLRLDVSPSNLSLRASADTLQLKVFTNNETYEVFTASDWLAVNKEDSIVNVYVTENITEKKRSARILFLVNSIAVSEVSVVQEKSDAFPLPSLMFGSTTAEIKAFENTRESVLQKEDDHGTGTLLTYNVDNKVFSQISYYIALNKYSIASMYARNNVFSEEDKLSFESFLLKQGFQRRTEKGYRTTVSALSGTLEDKEVFVHEKQQAKIELMEDKIPFYKVTYYPVQQVPQATLSVFPYFQQGATLEEVKEFEQQHMGVLDSTLSLFNAPNKSGLVRDKLYFTSSSMKSIARVYWVYHQGQTKQGLTQVDYYYDEAKWIYYQGLDGNMYLSEEFLSLAKLNGFTFEGISSSRHVFSHESSRMKMYTRWYKDESLGWVLRVSIY